MLFTGSSGLTTSRFGTKAICEIGVKSRTGLNESFR